MSTAAPEQASFSEGFDAAFAPEPSTETTSAPAETTPKASTEAPVESAGKSAVDTLEKSAESKMAKDNDVTEEPVVEEVDDPSDAALSLSPDELAAIKANPATAKLYKSLMRASTSKFQEISANKKFLDAVRENPRAVIESAARNMGLQLVDSKDPVQEERQSEVVDEVMDDMVSLFGPELAPAVRPVMEKMVRQLVDREIAPLRQDNEQRKQESYEKQAVSHAETFRAQHPDISPEVEAKMIEIGRGVFPAEGTNPVQYLNILHTLATAGNTAAQTAKVAAQRIKAAQENAEPRRGSAPVVTGGGGVKDDMTLSDAFDAAWEQVKSERGRS